MAENPVRHFETFENAAATIIYTFPQDNREDRSDQRFRRAGRALLGADYEHDFLGLAPAPKALGTERVRFTIWGTSASNADTLFEEAIQKLVGIGKGKLWSIDENSVRRWCWARLEGRPSYAVTVDQFYNIPVSCRFTRYSDWYAASATTASPSVAASGTTVLTNDGNAPVKGQSGLVFILKGSRSLASNVGLTNTTTGESIASTRDLTTTSQWLRIDCERQAVEYSANSGGSWADDYALVTLPATQVGFMTLDPGANTIRADHTGAAVTLDSTFRDTYG